MERRKKIGGGSAALGLLLASSLTFGVANAALGQEEPSGYLLSHGKKIPLVKAQDLVALKFEVTEAPEQARRSAEADAAGIGVDVVESQIGQNQLIVRSSPDEVRRSLRSRSDVSGRITAVRPVYYYNGIADVDYMITIPDRVIVALKKEVGLDQREELFQRYGLTDAEKIMDNVYRLSVPVTNEEIPGLAVKIYEENSDFVRYAEPSMEGKIKLLGSTALPAGDLSPDAPQGTGRDPLIGEQWHLHNSGRNTLGPSFAPADVDTDAPRAWNPNTRGLTRGDARTYGYFGQNGARPIIVAVYDSGSDLAHEDFVRNLNDPFLSSTARANVMRTDIDFDYFGNDPDADAGSALGEPHGTAVAGIIAAARNNGVGGVGVAPEVEIMTQRIGSAFGFASFDRIAQAIIEGTNRGADIGNHSWGTTGNPSVLEDAFEYSFYSGRFNRGTANFAAAGNERYYMGYPALYPSTFSVGGISSKGARVSYASWGGVLDFASFTGEFGEAGIVTTDISGSGGYAVKDETDILNPDGNYTFEFNGTSASTPVTVGVAALIMAEFPNVSIPPDVSGVDSLFDLMVRYSDKPGTPYDYMPDVNNSGRYEFFVSSDEPNAPPILRAVNGVTDVMGFRRDMGYNVDGFTYYFGYGSPNPFNVITGQTQKSSFRDYKQLSGLQDELTTQGIRLDFGEMVLVYESDFTGEYLAMRQECIIELFADDEGNLPDPFQPTPAQLLAIADCVLEKDGEWDMVGPRVESGQQTGPRETHFYLTLSDNVVIEHKGPVSTSGFADNPFPVVIHSNRPTNAAVEPTHFTYNNRGRYLPSSTYRVSANLKDSGGEPVGGIPIGEFADKDVPLFMDVTIKYELALQSGSTYNNPVTKVGVLRDEVETIRISANGRTVAVLEGDSNNFPIPPLVPANIIEGTPERAKWSFIYFYEQFKADPEFRTFRFYIGKSNFRPSIPVSFTMNTGPSYLPEWGAPQPNGTRTQTIDILRDHRGFQIANVKIWAADTEPDENTFLTAQQIDSPEAILQAPIGTRPQWTPSGNEVIFVDIDRQNPSLETEVYTISGDAFVRRMVPDNDSRIEVQRRERIPIFRTCTDIPDHINDCTPANLLSLDSDLVQARLLYVADSDSSAPRMFTVTEDGFDEQPVMPFDPSLDVVPLDRFVQEAVFARGTDSVIFTDREGIYIVENGGRNIEYVIDTDGIKDNPEVDDLQDFRGITGDNSDALIFFSALNRRTNDYNIYYTIRSLNLQSEPASYYPILEWDGSHEIHTKMSPDGKRLAFVSNTVDQGGGATPPPNAPSQIYLIDNVLDLALYPGVNPTIVKVDLKRDIRLSRVGQELYTSALFPAFHPAGSMLSFAGFPAQVNGTRGEIATVNIDRRIVIPPTLPPAYNPGPSPRPPAAPEEEPIEHLLQIGQNLFDVSNDGWEFGSASWLAMPSSSSEAGLELRANNDNTNTYGFFASPINALQLFSFPAILQNSSTPFQEREGPHYLLRYYIHRTTEDVSRAPTLRLRVNSYNQEDYHTLVASSLGSNRHVPGLNSTPVDLLFQPSPFMYTLLRNQQTYFMAFDLLNFDTADDPNGGYVLDRLDVFRVPLSAIETVGTVKEYQFDSESDFADWMSIGLGNLPPTFPLERSFADPAFGTGPSRLEMATVDPEFTYGYWQNKPMTVTVNPTGMEGTVYMRMTAHVGSEEPNPIKVPEMRLRLARDDWSVSSDHGVVGTASGTFIPSLNKPRVFRSYVQVPTDVSLVGFHGAWDLLSFETFATDAERNANGTSSSKVFLDDVKFDLIRLDGYPTVDPNP